MSLHPEFFKFRYAPKLDSDSTETIISEDFALTCIGWGGHEILYSCKEWTNLPGILFLYYPSE